MKKHRKINWIIAATGVGLVAILPILTGSDLLLENPLATALGRFHIPILHFPIALLLIVPILEVLGISRRRRHLREAVPVILLLCAVLSVITCVLGGLLAAGEGIRGALLNSHMLAGIITTVLVIGMVISRKHTEATQSKVGAMAYILMGIFSIASLTVGSHHGASMVHGEDYLYAHLPDKFKDLMGLPIEEEFVLDYDSDVYLSVITPILQENCYSCHDQSITKGGFRMDEYLELLAGGESKFAAITPGDSQTSELFRRITLDRSDKDAMPPKEKPPLESSEVALIQWWIDGGAPENMTLDALSLEYYPSEIETIIGSMLHPLDPVEPLDWDLLQVVAEDASRSFGIEVIPYSQNPEDGVYVVVRNSDREISESTLSSLLDVAPHVQSINLWNQALSEDALSAISIFPNLQELHLNQTNIEDADLSHLAGLRKLRSLNLHGTKISDSAVEILSSMRSLRKLFLADSKVTLEGIQQLRDSLPGTEVLWRDPSNIPAPTPEDIDIASSSFEPAPGWGVLHADQHDHGIGSTHGGVAVDKVGQIYVSSKSGIHIYSGDGALKNSYTGPDYSDFHSLLIVTEQAAEFIYGARNRDAEVLKLRLDGEIVLRLPFPTESSVEGKFMPTAAVTLPDGRIFVTDGYGTNRIFTFDESGTYLSLFGGKDKQDPSKFNTPHGIALDTRYKPARLLVSDREKRRLVHFDLNGKYIEEVITDLRRPCAVAILGEYVAVAELEGRVIILDGENNIVQTLGDNPDESQWANFKVAPEAWKDGLHTAPHGLAWDSDGNLYVQDWNSHGRITKWKRIPMSSGY